jgi:monoamine oxidase
MENRQRIQVKTVGVIGAGVSGVASAIHLRKAGLQVTVFERNSHVGGVWYVARSFLLIPFLIESDIQSGSSTSAHLKTPRIPPPNLQWAIRPSTKDRRLRARVIRREKTARAAAPLMMRDRAGKLLQSSLRHLGLATKDCAIMSPLTRWRCSVRHGSLKPKSL